jgi:ABC-type transport system involved in multi-copper enzyme maturation permease subunit
VLTLAAVLRPGRWKLFGPVFFYDLVRTTRRGRSFLLRCAYVAALLVALFLLYSRWAGGDLLGEARVPRDQLAGFAESFFTTFLVVQLAAVFLLTPAYTGPAIAEEKERRTLEHLLASDLRDREIVLGKLASRLLALFLILLAGLPVLGLLQLMGGVDPDLVLAGFAATAVTLVSLGSLGLVNSVHVHRPHAAIFATYLQAAGYLLLSSFCGLSPGGKGPNPLEWVGAGNAFVAYQRLSRAAAAGTFGPAVLPVLRDYVLFHGAAAVTFVVLASLRLRAWNREARPQTEREGVVVVRVPGEPVPLALTRQPPPLPRVGDDPLLWKELHVERGLQLPFAMQALLFLAAVILLVLAALALLFGLSVFLVHGRPSEFAHVWVQAVGTAVASLMVLAVGVRASTAFSGERDRRTLDGLLTTPLDNRTLLGGKWLGSLLSVRPAWVGLGVIWLLGLLTGGLHPLSALLLAAACAAYAAFAAGVGLGFSLCSRTSLRATVWTLVTLLTVGSGQPLYWLCGRPLSWLLGPAHAGRAHDPSVYAVTLPGSLAYLAFPWGDWSLFGPEVKESVGGVGVAWMTVCFYGAAAVALWGILNIRFGPITGRLP